MNQIQKENARLSYATLISMFLILGGWMCGFILSDGKAIWRVVCGGSVGLLALAAAIKIVRTLRFKKSFKNMTAQQFIEMGLEHKKRVEEDYEKAEKRLKSKIFRSYCWLASVTLLFFLMSFSLGMTGFGREKPVKLLILFLPAILVPLSYIGVLAVFFPPYENDLQNEKNLLFSLDYPRLYALVSRAAKAAGCRRHIQLLLTADGFFVAERDKMALVYIDGEEILLLTEEELFSVMLHEFAHVKNSDTVKLRRYGGTVEKWLREVEWSRLLSLCCKAARFLFLDYYIHTLPFENDLYRELSSRRREIRADELVKEKGYGQIYINATAKATLLSLYRQSEIPELAFDFYQSEEPSADYFTRSLSNFRKYLAKNEELWNYVLRHEIPARIDSHPTFRMRMEHMGVAEYDYTTEETDEDYLRECKKAIAAQDELALQGVKPDYKQKRVVYLRIREKMEEYEKAVAEGRPLTASKLVGYADAFLGICDDKVLEISDKILEMDPDSDFAAYYKGKILAERGQEEGIPLLYKAAKHNFDISEKAMCEIGTFALKMGRQDVLDEYRASVAGIMQRAMDRERNIGVRRTDKFFPNDMPPELLSEILRGILGEGEGKIRRVYSVRKTGRDGKPVFLYAVDFGVVSSWEEKGALGDSVFLYLSNSGLPEPFSRFKLYEATYSADIVKKMRREVKNCAIYDAERDSGQKQ